MKTILVADDEPNIRHLIQIYLERAGYRVETAENGQQAWERLQKAGIDLLITDDEMPEMDGFKLMGEVVQSREPLCSMPMILIGRDREPNWGYRLYPTFVLEKPFSPARLVEIVGRILEQC